MSRWNPANEVGNRYARLTVIANSQINQWRQPLWTCRCDCGALTLVVGASLRNGNTKSCGCLSRETRVKQGHANATHGLRNHYLYKTWNRMRQRCLDPNDHAYRLYGALGVTVCARWQGPDGFPSFLADVGERPEGKTLDRIDPYGNYEPGNVRWATPKEQRANQRKKGTL